MFPVYLTHKAVRLVAVEALGVCMDSSVEISVAGFEWRTLLDDRNMLLCGNHLCSVNQGSDSNCVGYALCLLLWLVVVTLGS